MKQNIRIEKKTSVCLKIFNRKRAVLTRRLNFFPLTSRVVELRELLRKLLCSSDLYPFGGVTVDAPITRSGEEAGPIIKFSFESFRLPVLDRTDLDCAFCLLIIILFALEIRHFILSLVGHHPSFIFIGVNYDGKE